MMVGLTLMKVASCRISVSPPNTTTMTAVTIGMMGNRRGMSFIGNFGVSRRHRRKLGNGAGEVAGGKRRQILEPFADTDIVDRHPELRRDGDQDAAACGAIELGHGKAGDADRLLEDLDLRQRILPNSSVEHQKNGVGCAVI